MSRIAESYVRLVLAVGEHSPDYVDAYYGPKEWRDEVAGQVKAGTLSLTAIRDQAAGIIRELEGMAPPATGGDEEEMTRLRHAYLLGQTRALSAYAGMLLGDKHTFDEESRLLYDAVAPHHDEEHFRAILAQLDKKLPGKGTISERYERFHGDFVIPRDKLDAVFQAALAEARKRVAGRMQLPEKESFEISYVTDKPWSGYNWYKGDGHSLIEINTDLPIYVDRAIDLACHEGYPGHHVYNALARVAASCAGAAGSSSRSIPSSARSRSSPKGARTTGSRSSSRSRSASPSKSRSSSRSRGSTRRAPMPTTK